MQRDLIWLLLRSSTINGSSLSGTSHFSFWYGDIPPTDPAYTSLPGEDPHNLLMFLTESEPCCLEASATRSALLLPGRASVYIWSINTHTLREASAPAFFLPSLSFSFFVTSFFFLFLFFHPGYSRSFMPQFWHVWVVLSPVIYLKSAFRCSCPLPTFALMPYAHTRIRGHLNRMCVYKILTMTSRAILNIILQPPFGLAFVS